LLQLSYTNTLQRAKMRGGKLLGYRCEGAYVKPFRADIDLYMMGTMIRLM
jgi:hypothetical protein